MSTHKSRSDANRANAQHSTGPRTEEGKRIASHNALKTGLTGRTVLLPTDDVAHYEAHSARVEARYQPQTDEERLYTQSIAHIEWRLLRIPTLETALLALGRKRFAGTHQDEPADLRALLIEAEVALEFQKPLANLALQEQRLNRQHEREIAKLQALLTARRAQETKILHEIANLYMHCEETEQVFPDEDLRSGGFEFSMDDVLRRVAEYETTKKRINWRTVHAHFAYLELKKAA